MGEKEEVFVGPIGGNEGEGDVLVVDLSRDSIPDLTCVPGGKEYELQIERASLGESKAGDPMITVIITIPSVANAKEIWHYLMLPTKDHDERQQQNLWRRLREFCEAFSIPYESGRLAFREWAGRSGFAIVKYQEDDQYGPSNSIGKLSTPKGKSQRTEVSGTV